MCKTIELRDQIALEAMKLALTDSAFYDAEHLAKNAYALADAMMAARTPAVAVNLGGDSVKVNAAEIEAEKLAESIRKFERSEPGYPL